MDRRLCQLLVACTKGGLEELRVQFGKVWVQGTGANGQSIRPKDRRRQIRGDVEGGAPSEHEWGRINKPGDVAEREEHHADVEQEAAEFETKYAWRIDRRCEDSGIEVDHACDVVWEAGVLKGKWFITYADLRASVIRFLDHNVPVSVVKTSSSSTANFAQN